MRGLQEEEIAAAAACHAELSTCAGTDMATCFLPKVNGKGPCTSASYKAYQNAVKPGSLVAKLGTLKEFHGRDPGRIRAGPGPDPGRIQTGFRAGLRAKAGREDWRNGPRGTHPDHLPSYASFARTELFAAAVDTAVDHLNKACGGRWPGILPGYRRGLPTSV